MGIASNLLYFVAKTFLFVGCVGVTLMCAGPKVRLIVVLLCRRTWRRLTKRKTITPPRVVDVDCVEDECPP